MKVGDWVELKEEYAGNNRFVHGGTLNFGEVYEIEELSSDMTCIYLRNNNFGFSMQRFRLAAPKPVEPEPDFGYSKRDNAIAADFLYGR
jgi:hypothetical protein